MSLRHQRIENEWAALQQMADANPAILIVRERRNDEFLLVLGQTPAAMWRNSQIELAHDHELRACFPRFFPTAPIEAYLASPVFHPNIHPTTGFVCLWGRFSVTDTIAEALCRLQRILTFDVFSESPDDVMQPEALKWAVNPNRGIQLPLRCSSLMKPASWPRETEARNRPLRRRLS